MRSAVFARDDSSALTVDGAGAARLWSIPDGAALATLGTARVTTASYTRDANVVATAGERSTTLWTMTGQELVEIPTGYAADRLVIDPSGRWLFVRGVTTSVLVIDLALRRPATHLTIRNNDVRAIAADASRVAITDGRTIRLWELGTWQPAGEFVAHRSTVEDLWFLADGRLVSAANDTVLVWGVDGRLQGRFADGERVFDVAASPDGAFIATSCNDGAIRIWDAQTYRRLLVLPSHHLPVFNVSITHDSAAVLSAGSDGLLVRRELDHQARAFTALAEIVRCRVPLRLEGELALPHELDFADPTCGSLH
jgi:WD40 repeat protein